MLTLCSSSSDKRTKFQLVNKLQTAAATTPNTRCNTMLILLQVHLRFVQLALWISFGRSNQQEWDGGECGTYEKQSAYRVLVGRPEGKRLLGRPRSTWEDNIKIDLEEMGWGMDGISLMTGARRVAGAYECGYEPSGSIKCGEFLD